MKGELSGLGNIPEHRISHGLIHIVAYEFMETCIRQQAICFFCMTGNPSAGSQSCFAKCPCIDGYAGSLPAVKVHMGAAENFTHRSCEAGSVPGR